jgi:hypothetical protein
LQRPFELFLQLRSRSERTLKPRLKKIPSTQKYADGPPGLEN